MDGTSTTEVFKERKETVRFLEDLYYVNLLVSGENRAWDLFYKEYRRKLEGYIETRYPNVFGVSDIEDICDGVQNRLRKNDCRALREYEGNCTFARYLTQATDWEIKDWFKKNSHRLYDEPIEEVLNREELSTKDQFDNLFDTKDCAEDSAIESEHLDDAKNKLGPISSLPDDLRHAFLLRYYDQFGFPPEEIRLLSKKRGIPVREISEVIIRHLELKDEDLLASRRENQQAFEERLQRLFSGISRLRDKERKLLEKLRAAGESGKKEGCAELEQKLKDIREKLASKEGKREQLKEEGNAAVTTPYETIGMILGEDNLSTVRSRVFHAKKILKDILQRGRNR